ncbi:MAG: hypothetical protein J7M19_08455 [Planctomycetes bacterium]|nr:hypothetical protein [Planctomycetota bacterium]
MVRHLSLVLLTVSFAFGCGPRYSVYNGGIASPQTPARQLQPTEAVGLFSTDYASPEPDVIIGGPTNRVRTDVPEALSHHGFINLSTSDNLSGLRQEHPVESRSVGHRLESNADCTPARSITEPLGAGKVSAVSQAGAVSNTGGLTADATNIAHTIAQDSSNVSLASKAATTAQRTRNQAYLGVGDSDSTLQPVKASQPLVAETVVAASVMETPGSSHSLTAPESPNQAVGTLVAEARTSSLITRSIEKSTVPLKAEIIAGASEHRDTASTASRAAPASPRNLTKKTGANLLAERDVLLNAWDVRQNLAVVASEGPVSYTRRQIEAVLADCATVESGTSADTTPQIRNIQPAVLLGVAESDSVRLAQTPSAVIGTQTSEAVSGGLTAKALRVAGGIWVSRNVTAVSPPWLCVVKEAKLLGNNSIKKLLEQGVLKEKPRSAAVIRYRIFVFNKSDSIARDVQVVDRLDPKVSLVAWSAPQPVEFTYDPETRKIETTLSRLEPMYYFVLEFYVDLAE